MLFVGVGVVSAINCNFESINLNNKIGKLKSDKKTFYPSDDSWVSHDESNVPKGDSVDFLIRNEYGFGGSPGWAVDSLVKFDISSIPKGTIINSAKLKLFYYKYRDNNPGGRELNVYKVISDWDENTVTWDTQPIYHSIPTTSSSVPSSIGSWMEWDVTNDVQDFIDRTVTNYVWKITDENYWGKTWIPIIHFRSKEYSSNLPYLEIEVIELRSALLFGRIKNLNAEGNLITFNAVNLRYLQFLPFSFNTYISGEKIVASEVKFGILTINFAFGFFKAALV